MTPIKMAPIKIIHFTLHDLHIRLTFITLKKQETFSEINETSRYFCAQSLNVPGLCSVFGPMMARCSWNGQDFKIFLIYWLIHVSLTVINCYI